MNASRQRKGLSLSKNLRTGSYRALTSSSFSQNISFIDKVLPDNDTKQIQPNSVRSSNIFQSRHSQVKPRRSIQSHTDLEQTKTAIRIPQKFKYVQSYHKYAQESNRSYFQPNNVPYLNEEINLRHILMKLSAELQSLNLEKENFQNNVKQMKSKHDIKMAILRQRRHNLKQNIRKLTESKNKEHANNLPIKSNIIQIQQLNIKINGLIQDIESTFAG